MSTEQMREGASEHEGFGATYYTVSSNTVAWSLRCVAGKDVSAIARTLGGGGHARAAGFSVRLT